jgi:O-antigen/teichoic acid export membrane protein
MLALVKVYTWLLDPAAYGQYALALSLGGLAGMLLFQPIGQTLARFHPECIGGGVLLLRRIGGALLLASALVLAAASVAALVLGAGGSPEGAILAAATALFAIVSGANAVLAAWYNAERRRALVALVLAGEVWMRVLAGAAAVLLLAPVPAAVLGGAALGVAGVLWLGSAPLRRDWREARARRLSSAARAPAWPELAAYAWPFSAAAVFAAAGLYADRWVLGLRLGAADVGLYYALLQIAAAPVAGIGGTINQLVTPLLYGAAALGPEHADRLLLRAWLASAALWSLLVVAVAMHGALLVRLLSNASYAVRADLLWVLTLGLCLFHLAQLLALRAQVRKCPSRNLAPKGLHGLAAVGLMAWLARDHGFAGVCWGMAAAALLYLVAVAVANRFPSPSPPPAGAGHGA